MASILQTMLCIPKVYYQSWLQCVGAHDGTTIIGQLDYSPYAPHYVLHALKMEFHYAGVLIRKFVEIPGGGSDMLT